MDPLQIAASYDRIAERWAGSGFDRSDGMRQHELALTFMRETGPALDVGCGSSGRFIDLLASRGFEVEGLDLSAEMLRLARLKHPQVMFYEADICEWDLPRAYHFITAWDSIWHVPLSQQQAVLLKLCAGLAAGGILIFSAGGLPESDERRDEAMGVPMYHATIGVPQMLRAIDEAGCALRHFEYDQPPEDHVFFIVQRP